MHYLATLQLPGGQSISAPDGIPTGGLSSLEKILQGGLTILFITAIILALVYLIWGGINWIMSGGDKEKIGKARAKLTYAIIGLIVTLLAFFVVNIVNTLFNINT